MIRATISTIAIFFLLFITTCTHMVVNKHADYSCIIEPKPDELSKDRRARKFKVVVDFTSKLSEYDQGRILVASHLAAIVIRTEEFRQAVLNYEHNGIKGFLDTNLTRKQVYNAIIDGAEKHDPSLDSTMSFVATSFKPTKEDSRTVAFVYSSKKWVYFSEDYLFHNTANKANTVVHEWLHMIGFEHEKDDGETREYSVPYAVGDIVQDIASNHYRSECWWK